MHVALKENTLAPALLVSFVLHSLCLAGSGTLGGWLDLAIPPASENNMLIEFEWFAPEPSPALLTPSPLPPENVPAPQEAEVPPEALVVEDTDPPVPEEADPPLFAPLTESVPLTEEPTSSHLQTAIDLDPDQQIREESWDYCNRIGTLIAKYAEVPPRLREQGRFGLELIKVEITLDRGGRLIRGTPKIMPGHQSAILEINQAALTAVLKAAPFFPPLPQRLPRDEITFTVPLRFQGRD